MPPRKPKGLSPEDLELWSQVARSAKPLHPSKVPDRPAAHITEPRREKKPIPSFSIGQHATPKPQTVEPPTHHVAMDHKAFTRLKRGKLKPEARIDLHGMTLAQAHPALIRFILTAHGQGKRLVLVITGKGRNAQDDGPIPIRKGVLRQQVPLWLSAPPLNAHVLQVTEAHISHGGSGAYYVYLRRAR